MSSQHQFMHGQQEKQERPQHSHAHHTGQGLGDNPHLHAAHSGSMLMPFLMLMHHIGLYRIDPDYRSPRLAPASGWRLAATLLAVAAGWALWRFLPASLAGIGLAVMLLAAAYLLLLVVGGIAITLFMRQQRRIIRQKMLGAIPWNGTERVLDVACGSGMMLNGCAQRLTSGWAVGIDQWEQEVGGTRELTLANARAEGVADKVDLREMDARHLEFEDAQFDVVVSSMALHHIGTTREDLHQALSEMIRVLAPGGILSLADVPPMIDIAEKVLAHSGLEITRQEQTRFLGFVTARKA